MFFGSTFSIYSKVAKFQNGENLRLTTLYMEVKMQARRQRARMMLQLELILKAHAEACFPKSSCPIFTKSQQWGWRLHSETEQNPIPRYRAYRKVFFRATKILCTTARFITRSSNAIFEPSILLFRVASK